MSAWNFETRPEPQTGRVAQVSRSGSQETLSLSRREGSTDQRNTRVPQRNYVAGFDVPEFDLRLSQSKC